jgi:transporter family-2 protein
MKYLLILAAFIAGTSMPLQSAVNSRLSQYLHGTLYSAFISFAGGLILLAFLIIASGSGLPPLSSFSGIKWYYYTGGIYGVMVITSIIFAAPVIGIGSTLVMIVTGQLLMSVVFDYFGFFGMPVIALSPARIAGVVLIIAGVALVQTR